MSDEEEEDEDFLVCNRAGVPSPFTDNVTGVCVQCGHGIYFRPHAPKTMTRLCMECLAVRMKESTEDMEFTATETTMNELKEHFKKEARKKLN